MILCSHMWLISHEILFGKSKFEMNRPNIKFIITFCASSNALSGTFKGLISKGPIHLFITD